MVSINTGVYIESRRQQAIILIIALGKRADGCEVVVGELRDGCAKMRLVVEWQTCPLTTEHLGLRLRVFTASE